MTEFWLQFDWILTDIWLHFDCILTKLWLYLGCILTALWLNFAFILPSFWLKNVCTPIEEKMNHLQIVVIDFPSFQISRKSCTMEPKKNKGIRAALRKCHPIFRMENSAFLISNDAAVGRRIFLDRLLMYKMWFIVRLKSVLRRGKKLG